MCPNKLRTAGFKWMKPQSKVSFYSQCRAPFLLLGSSTSVKLHKLENKVTLTEVHSSSFTQQLKSRGEKEPKKLKLVLNFITIILVLWRKSIVYALKKNVVNCSKMTFVRIKKKVISKAPLPHFSQLLGLARLLCPADFCPFCKMFHT